MADVIRYRAKRDRDGEGYIVLGVLGCGKQIVTHKGYQTRESALRTVRTLNSEGKHR